MNDTRIHEYLTTGASALDLPGGDLNAIVSRARRRRRNRGVGMVVAVALTVGTGAAVLSGPEEQALQYMSPSSLTPSPFDWTLVEPVSGMVSKRSTALTDGSIYSLSTAPGAVSTGDEPLHLYRSVDGAEWDEVALPDDLWAGSLTSVGSSLYAVGTAPGPRGGAQMAIAVTDDGGTSWRTEVLTTPDLDVLVADHPGQVTARSMVVVDGPAGLVGAVRVHSNPDVGQLLPPDVDLEGRWTSIDTRGVIVFDQDTDGPGGDVDPWTTDVDGLVARYSWDELGYPTALADLVRGRLHTFSLTEDGQIEDWQQPAPGSTAYELTLLAADDGYRLLHTGLPDGAGEAATMALYSADGRRWEADPQWSPVTASLLASGHLDGRPSVTLSGAVEEGGPIVWTVAADGTWNPFDLAEVLHDTAAAGVDLFFPAAEYGPLGLAAVAEGHADGRQEGSYVIHTPDGRSVSVVDLSDHLADGDPARATSVSVTADAVLVGLTDPRARHEEGPSLRLLVGTPRG